MNAPPSWKTPPLRPPRRLPKTWRTPVRSYAIAVGELVWSANQAQSSFANLFAILVSPDNLRVGYGIWYSMPSDKAQLDALSELAKQSLNPQTRLAKCAEWAIRVARELAVYRNDAAHGSTAFAIRPRPFSVVPHPINNTTTRLKRLEKQVPLKQFRAAKGDYIQLGVYVHELFCHLAYPEMEVSLPLKPSLALVRK